MLCNGAKLFRAFLCLVAQRKGMVITMKKSILPLARLLTVVQLGSAIAFAAIMVYAKEKSYWYVMFDNDECIPMFMPEAWWKQIFSLSPTWLPSLLCIGLAVAVLITVYVRKRKPAVSLPIMTALTAVAHSVLFVPYSLANLQNSCDTLVSNIITYFRPDTPSATITNCENALCLTLPILFAAGTAISLALFILTLRPLIQAKKEEGR